MDQFMYGNPHVRLSTFNSRIAVCGMYILPIQVSRFCPYVLCFLELTSESIILVGLHEIDTDALIDCFWNYFVRRYGVPRMVILSRDSCFLDDNFQNFLIALEVCLEFYDFAY